MNIEVFSDGSELWDDIAFGKNKYELLYLDIEMVRINGIEVARKIRENDADAILIYISAYDNYFIELFEVEPFRFIKKPVDDYIFEVYFNKAYERILNDETYFEYRFNKADYKIPINNISYFESSGRLINIIHMDGKDKFYGKLNYVEKQLGDSKIPFLRIHQSYLVNYRFICKISFSHVTLRDGTVLQISEDRQKKIREQYNKRGNGDFLCKKRFAFFIFIDCLDSIFSGGYLRDGVYCTAIFASNIRNRYKPVFLYTALLWKHN